MEIRRLDLDEWDRRLPGSGFAVFHLPEVLGVLDDHTDAVMHLIGGFKGQEPVGMVPVFVSDSVVGRTVFSPPPSMGVPHLGPVLMPSSPKRRKIERVNRTFTREVVAELDLNSRFTLFRMVAGPMYTDPRPYHWTDHRVTPRFTYRLAVQEDPDQLLGRFSSDLRREIRNLRDVDLEVSVERESGTRRVARDVITRYDEQDESAPITARYVCDLVEALGDRARTYVARDSGGNYQGGIIVLYSNDTAYYWQGGVSGTYDGISVNSLLHWRIIEDIGDGSPMESVVSYDLVGANTERLSIYKSKFNPDLVPYYLLESTGPAMTAAKTAYRVLSK